MVGVETPSSLAVWFIDKPLTYNSTAAAFRASGLPRAGVSVKVKPQALHKSRCLPRISPFLTYLALPQRLQHTSMATLPKGLLPQTGRASLHASNPCFQSTDEVRTELPFGDASEDLERW